MSRSTVCSRRILKALCALCQNNDIALSAQTNKKSPLGSMVDLEAQLGLLPTNI